MSNTHISPKEFIRTYLHVYEENGIKNNDVYSFPDNTGSDD